MSAFLIHYFQKKIQSQIINIKKRHISIFKMKITPIKYINIIYRKSSIFPIFNTNNFG